MITTERRPTWVEQHSYVRYIAPFAAFMLFLLAASEFHFNLSWESPVRVIVLGAVCVWCWPRDLELRPKRWLASVLVGAAVFLFWIAPEVLLPRYRDLPLFSNLLIDHARSSMPADALHSWWVLGWRSARAILIVPIVEELFWRGWLMRWIIDMDFERVPLGTYALLAFWGTAILFGSEHGPYWDVGLIAGIVYNFWAVRTKSLADCVLMHAMTNALLSSYVIASGQWQYWQ